MDECGRLAYPSAFLATLKNILEPFFYFLSLSHICSPISPCHCSSGILQKTVTREGQEVDLRARGRHDPCVVPRAVPMVDAMVALVLADQLLQHYAQCELLTRDGAVSPDKQVLRQFSRA